MYHLELIWNLINNHFPDNGSLLKFAISPVGAAASGDTLHDSIRACPLFPEGPPACGWSFLAGKSRLRPFVPGEVEMLKKTSQLEVPKIRSQIRDHASPARC